MLSRPLDLAERRLKLLLLAFAYPPSRAVGALRPWYLAKHLSALQWDVTVVTVNPSLLAEQSCGSSLSEDNKSIRIKVIPTGLARRFLCSGWYRLRWWERPQLVGKSLRFLSQTIGLDVGSGWVRSALTACQSLSPGDVDLVLATAPPHSAFSLARALAKKLKCPYAMDYRDAWSLNPHVSTNRGRSVAGRERRLLAEAAGVSIVSNLMAQDMQNRLAPTCPVAVIRNGYDAADFDGLQAATFADFAVVYAGTFYPEKRSVRPLLQAVLLANERSAGMTPPVRLHYYGPDGEYVLRWARRLGAVQYAVVHGVVPRRQALEAQKGATVVAVITTVEDQGDLAERGIMTGKLFEAIALGCQTLLIAPQGSEAGEILKQTNGGRHFRGSEIHQMAAWLTELIVAPSCRRRTDAGAYRWPAIARKADKHLRECLHGAGQESNKELPGPITQ